MTPGFAWSNASYLPLRRTTFNGTLFAAANIVASFGDLSTQHLRIELPY